MNGFSSSCAVLSLNNDRVFNWSPEDRLTPNTAMWTLQSYKKGGIFFLLLFCNASNPEGAGILPCYYHWFTSVSTLMNSFGQHIFSPQCPSFFITIHSLKGFNHHHKEVLWSLISMCKIFDLEYWWIDSEIWIELWLICHLV